MAAASAAAGARGQRDTPGQREQQQPVHGKGLLDLGKDRERDPHSLVFCFQVQF